MGLCIHLYINFDEITQEEWEKVYLETKDLIENFPLRLMRLSREKTKKGERIIFTPRVFEKEGTKEERWNIIGDLDSRQRGENFILWRYAVKRHQEQYGTNPKKKKRDMLWADESWIDYIDINGTNVFGSKTQGLPYHYFMIAVGILFENRFPGKAVVIGDITLDQAKITTLWLNKILPQPVELPVCAHGEGLWKRLSPLYDSPQLAIKRFSTLFRGSREDQFQSLISLAPLENIKQYLFEIISCYTSFHQIGASRVIESWLHVTNDIISLIQLLLPIMNTDSASGDDKKTIKELLEVVIETSTDAEKIREAFSTVFPDKKELFPQMIKNILSHNKEKTTKVESQLNNFLKGLGLPVNEPITLEDVTEKWVFNNNSLETLLAKKIKDQEIEYAKYDQNVPLLISAMAEIKDRILKEDELPLETWGVEELQENISFFTCQQGIPISEAGWNTIDSEKSMTILRYLLTLSLLDNNEMGFWKLRLYIFENQRLWHLFIQEEIK